MSEIGSKNNYVATCIDCAMQVQSGHGRLYHIPWTNLGECTRKARTARTRGFAYVVRCRGCADRYDSVAAGQQTMVLPA